MLNNKSHNQFCFLLIIILVSFFTVSCSPHEDPSKPGYVEGKYTYVSANETGVLKSFNVRKGEEIKAGQLLFTLLPGAENYDIATAEERVKQAKDQVDSLKEEYTLQKNLNKRRSGLTQDEIDTRKARYEVANSNLQAAKKNLAALESNLQKLIWSAKQKKVYAPVDGLVFDTYFTVGEFVQAALPVVALLNTSHVKIVFYLNEQSLGKFKLNQVVNIHCDNCSKTIKAKIIYISPQPEFTPPVIYSNEERSKLVYRVEAEPTGEKSYSILHPGQPVTVTME